VLAALSARGPAIQRDLAKSLNTIGPSIVKRIDQLESAGLVTRSPVPGDRRAALVDLTADGKALIARVRDVMRATEDALTAGLDPGEVQATRRVLAQVAERARTLRAERTGRANGPSERAELSCRPRGAIGFAARRPLAHRIAQGHPQAPTGVGR
jgi:DNA-binding MarR family transcriptional regulator